MPPGVVGEAETHGATDQVNIFFYGLFMDMGVLQQREFAPRHPQFARLDGHDLDIRVGSLLLALASTPRRYACHATISQSLLGQCAIGRRQPRPLPWLHSRNGVGRHIIPQLAERLCHVTYGGTLLLSARHTRRACVHASDAASTNGVMT